MRLENRGTVEKVDLLRTLTAIVMLATTLLFSSCADNPRDNANAQLSNSGNSGPQITQNSNTQSAQTESTYRKPFYSTTEGNLQDDPPEPYEDKPSNGGQPGVADAPVIISGGSLTIWSKFNRLTYNGFTGGVHKYTYTYEARKLSQIDVVLADGPSGMHPKEKSPIGVDIWYEGGGDDPDISIRENIYTFKSSVQNMEPLEYIGQENPGFYSEALHRHNHRVSGSKITYVRVWMTQGRYHDYWAFDPNRPPRAQLRYNK